MKTLIVYDSAYGNTEEIARAIGDGLGGARLARPADVRASDLEGLDLLIVGSPTQGGRATPALKQLLDSIPKGGLEGVDVAAFDTRFSGQGHGLFLRLLMRATDFAAPRVARQLQAKGGHLVASPEGFIVLEKEGPLQEGETQHAREWAQGILARAA